MNIKLLAVAIAGLSLAAGVAQASGSNANNPVLTTAANGSDLVLSVWDVTAKTSYALNLGVTQNAFLATPAFATETLSSANWGTFVGSINAGDTVNYQVESAAKTVSNTGFGLTVTESLQSDNALASQYATTTDVVNSFATSFATNGAVQNYATKLDSYLGVFKTGIGATAADDFATSSNSWYVGAASSALGLHVSGGLPTSDLATVALGQNANFFFATGPANTALTDAWLGAWNLSQNGTLSFTAAPPVVSSVPLPATAWMMISGLMGFLSLNQRKKAA